MTDVPTIDALDELDRRIAAALVQDGRAPWRRIAAALGEPERSVARRGARLLDDGIVRVLAIPNPVSTLGALPHTLRVAAAPNDLAEVAEALAGRDDVPWVSVLATSSECIGEAYLPIGGMPGFLDAVRGIPGVTGYQLEPITRYRQTSSGWRPGVLTAAEQASLHDPGEHAALFTSGEVDVDEGALELLRALAHDGRATAESVARALSITKATAGSRIERARTHGQIFIRGLVSPFMLGYPVEAHIRIEPGLAELDAVADGLTGMPHTRVCAVAGTGVIANLVATDPADLERILRELVDAHPSAEPLHVDLVARSLKRSAVRFSDERPEAAMGDALTERLRSA
ncbi:Lrp/AsnC family transcriptional regulator [Agromyces sp. LHK192]|uniref:Lrp/AsnC family transcriptional regulator n=1 Tax=Agromyces sp. LHK192 TaxID=2498704 RepID=UPI000FDA3351|nr:Lrp/AsnC family transcriptional regulator [Agromyces sp. LHK192]